MKAHNLLTIIALSLNITPSLAGIFSPLSKSAKEPAYAAPEKRLDYKQTFKRPFYYNGSVPFWTTGGDIIQSDEFIRLSPSVPNTKGWIWSELENPNEEWEAEVVFKVTGNSMHGGRGLAFWYTKEIMKDGPVFGSQDKWDGLSVWLDSANPKTRTPTTMVVLNDGTKAFASGLDPMQHMLGSCAINYRNSPTNVHLKVSYAKKILTVAIDSGSAGKDFRECLQAPDIHLPKGYHFGLSAASHSPADDHDIISFETWQLTPPAKLEHPKRPLEEEMIKRGEEFKEIDEEQKKKIEDAENQIRRMREQSRGEEEQGETSTSLARLFQMVQRQIEALGAPTPEMILQGNYEKKPSSSSETSANVGILNVAIERLSETVSAKMDIQDRMAKELLGKLEKLEKLIVSLESRMAIQSTTMQNKMSEINKNSAEAKGTMSTLKNVFYICIAQIFLASVYSYWKMRVERNEKKFL